jgi:solute carrier family 25 oxoglutarate transporter 11
MPKILEKVEPFVCGGVAAMFASSVIHPIDLAKVRLQLMDASKGAKPSFVKILKTMAREQGVASCYAGLSAALLRQAVYGTARIGLHRTFSDILVARNKGEKIGFTTKALSGMASGSIAVCIGTPFDVCLVRMQSDSSRPEATRRNYKNIFDALIRVTREEGFGALYSGLAPNILRGMSMNVGMLACYDQAKEFVGHNVTNDPNLEQPRMSTRILSAGAAGFTAALFSLPFDLMKSRLQSDNKYKGLADAFTKILRNEGPLAFWTGFGAYYGRCAPHSMIILLTTESITQYYRAYIRGIDV